MHKMRVAACLALLAASAGARAANAGALEEGAERYRPYLIEGVASALTGARALRECAAAADLPGAKKAWLSARAGWERSEMFTAGFVPELDAQIDAWPNADTVRLAYEVGESKADGGESRISGTSLDDMRNNIAGIDFAYHTIFSSALNTVDGKLDVMVTNRIEQLEAIVATPDLPHVDIADLRRTSEELVVALQGASAKLGLQRPTLEAQAR